MFEKLASPTESVLCPELDPSVGVSFRLPTVDEEWVRLSGYLDNMPWYDTREYKLAMPDNPIFVQYLKKRVGTDRMGLDVDGFTQLERAFRKDIFKESDYATELDSVANSCRQLAQVLPVFLEHQKQWGFYVPANGYEVVMTKYGTTGSYDSTSNPGRLTIRTEKDVKERMVHEAVHVGLNWLVKLYHMDHDAKESFVDYYMRRFLSAYFPNFEAQGPYIFEDVTERNINIGALDRYMSHARPSHESGLPSHLSRVALHVVGRPSSYPQESQLLHDLPGQMPGLRNPSRRSRFTQSTAA
jgi:hypothetical protein